MTLSLIHWFNLWLGGYSIWSMSTSRTISEGENWGLSTSQPRRSQGSTRKTTRGIQRTPNLSNGFQMHSKALDGHLQKYSTPAGLDYEELGGLTGLGQQDCSRAWNILEKGVLHGYILSLTVTTRTAVELAYVQGNYPTYSE